MVTITNGRDSFRVPTGSVKPYLSMGFRVVSDAEVKDMEQAGSEQQDTGGPVTGDIGFDNEDGEESQDGNVSAEESFVVELLEKPLSQWTNEEVKEFVRIKDIDTAGAQKVSQVRAIIKTYLEEQSKNA